MLQRFSIALILLSGLAAGTAAAQSQPPPEGDLPDLCKPNHFYASKPTDDDSPPKDPGCPQSDRRPGTQPTGPDPFIPDPPPIRRQN
jgi:hypothetical protein